MIIKLAMLCVFFAVTIGVGLYCRRHATDVHGFVLGGRSVGPWLTAFAYGTSYFSAVIFIGYAGQFGWRFGIASTWIGIGNALVGSLLAWMVLGRRTRLMTQHFESATMPAFFGRRFQSRNLRVVTAIIIFIFLIPYTASLYNGLSRLFGMAFDMDYTLCIIGMAVLTGIYVVAGGYMATAINDFIQGCIMLVGITAVIWAVLAQNGGLMGSLEALAAVSDPTVSDISGVFNSFFGPSPWELLSVIILTSLGTWGLPQMVGKFYAIESERVIDKGALVSTVFALVVAGGCYFLGGFGRVFTTPEVVAAQGYDAIIPLMLETLSPLLIGVIVVLVLSASMSTLSSLVLASGSTMTMDLIQVKIAPKMLDKTALLTIRILVLVFIAISACIAILQYKYSFSFIAQMMGLSWGALAGAFLAPLLYSLYWKRVTKASVFVNYVWGCGLMIANMLVGSSFPTFMQSSITCGAIAMLGGLVIVPVVSLFTQAPDQTMVDNAFACYETEVVVHRKNYLGD